jgi:Flp pilus assembly protein TadG
MKRLLRSPPFVHKRCDKTRRRGSATIEMAVLLPLLLTIALICVDYGRFVHWHIAVTNAARAGAGWGANHPTTAVSKPLWDAGVRRAIENELETNNWFDAAKLSVPTSTITNDAGGLRRVTIAVEYPFDAAINWPFLPGYNDTLTLKKTVVMRLVRG